MTWTYQSLKTNTILYFKKKLFKAIISIVGTWRIGHLLLHRVTTDLFKCRDFIWEEFLLTPHQWLPMLLEKILGKEQSQLDFLFHTFNCLSIPLCHHIYIPPYIHEWLTDVTFMFILTCAVWNKHSCIYVHDFIFKYIWLCWNKHSCIYFSDCTFR